MVQWQHTCNPPPWLLKQEVSKFKASLSSMAKAQNPASVCSCTQEEEKNFPCVHKMYVWVRSEVTGGGQRTTWDVASGLHLPPFLRGLFFTAAKARLAGLQAAGLRLSSHQNRGITDECYKLNLPLCGLTASHLHGKLIHYPFIEPASQPQEEGYTWPNYLTGTPTVD